MSERSTSARPVELLVAVAALGLLAAQAIRLSVPVAVASLVMAVGATPFVGAPARSIAALAAALSLAMMARLPWQVAMGLALGLFLLVGRRVPALGPSSAWRASGSIPVWPTILTGGITPFALTGWLLLARPNLQDILRNYIPDYPLAVLVAGAVVFACVNATLEELIWRGVLQDRLEPLFGGAAAIALQAASFGLQHANGFPRCV